MSVLFIFFMNVLIYGLNRLILQRSKSNFVKTSAMRERPRDKNVASDSAQGVKMSPSLAFLGVIPRSRS